MGCQIVGENAVILSTTAKRASVLLAVVAAVLVSLLFAQTAFAFELSQTDKTVDANRGFKWVMSKSSGTLTLYVPSDEDYAKYLTGSEDDYTLTIPATMENKGVAYEVKSVGVNTQGADESQNTFNTYIKKLQLPKSITGMYGTGFQSFPYRFKNLTDIEFYGEGDIQLTKIGSSAVTASTAKAEGAVFPSSLVRFNAGSVETAEGAEYFDVVIPSSVTSLSYHAFINCSATSVYVPSSIISETSTDQAFCGMPLLTKMVNASNVWFAFGGTTKLTDCRMLGTYGNKIPNNAYSGWESLKNYEISEQVAEIGADAFKDCANLESVTINGESLLKIGKNAFNGAEKVKTFSIPSSVTYIGDGAFANTGITALDIPDGVTYIGKGAFSGTEITEINIPASLEELVPGVFAGSKIKKVAIPDMLNDIPASRFTGEPLFGKVEVGWTWPLFISDFNDTNDALEDADLSAYKQSYLPSYMFANCTALAEIALPKNITNILPGAFAGCTALSKVYYYGDVGMAQIANSEKATHNLGYEYFSAGAFSEVSGSDNELGTLYSNKKGITFYGMGIAENNKLKEYADANECSFVPLAFLSNDGETATLLEETFGYVPPVNKVTVADIKADEKPVFEVEYTEDGMSRAFTGDDDGVEITYYLGGKEVTTFEMNGTYTAVIKGDGKSAFGSTTVEFTVSGGKDPVVEPIDDPNPVVNPETPNANATQQVSLSTSQQATSNGALAQTGDVTPVQLIVCVVFVACAGLVMSYLVLRRRKD